MKGHVMSPSYSKHCLLVVWLLSLAGCGWLTQKGQESAQAPAQAAVDRTVYGVGVSPYVRKVRVVLNEKKLPYTHKEVLPTKLLNALKQPIPQDFQQASPLGKIPAYREGDWTIADSAVIAQYLEHNYPEHKLYPSDPREYARALWFEKYGDEVLAGVIHAKIFMERFVKPQVLKQATDEETVQAALKNELPPLLDYLESQLQDKQWLVGNSFSIADIAIATHFVSLQLIGEKLNDQRWPKLAAYITRVLERPSFKQA